MRELYLNSAQFIQMKSSESRRKLSQSVAAVVSFTGDNGNNVLVGMKHQQFAQKQFHKISQYPVAMTDGKRDPIGRGKSNQSDRRCKVFKVKIFGVKRPHQIEHRPFAVGEVIQFWG